MKRIFCLVAVLGALALGMNAVANPFGAGNIVVVRVGDGSQAITNTGNTVFLDEYTTNAIWAAAGGGPPTPVQSIQMPTSWVGRNGPLVIDGSTIPNGGLSLSTDGRFLLLAGFGPTIGQVLTQALDSTTTTGLVGQVARVIGLVDGNGHVYTTTTLIDANEDGNAIHSAVSLDGTNIWHVGEGAAAHTGGKYTTVGSMISTQVEELSSFNGRRFGIFNKTLYYSANHILGAPTNTSVSVNPFGGSMPTSFVTSNYLYLAGVLGNSITNSPAIGSPYDFVMFNLSGVGTAPDTLYIANNTSNAPGESVGHGGAVLKYCYIPASNAWVNVGDIYAEQAVGLTGVKTGTNTVDLYITAGGTLTAVHLLYPYHDNTGFGVDPANNNIGPDANQNSELLWNSSVINTRGIAFAPQGGNAGTISAGAGVISVGPPFGPFFSGPQGGPFSPTNGVAYSVANLGGASTNFTVTFAGAALFTATPSSGTLASGASTTVTLTPNANANAKAGGFTYTQNVIFHAGGAGGTAVGSVLATLEDFAFFIIPSSNFVALGEPGGPFAPSSYVYELTNVTTTNLAWTANTSDNWNTLSATNGTLPSHAGTNITVSINPNANSLPVGTYQDTLLFTNVVANAALPPVGIFLQVGFGFFDDFSTYATGPIIGQNNWYNPSSALVDNGYIITNGVFVTPAGFDDCNDIDGDAEPAKNIASMVVTDGTAFGYLGMSVTVTSAPPAPNTWDFTILPTGPPDNPTVSVTYNEARTSTSDTGSGQYKWWTHVNGFDSLVSRGVGRTYGQQYIVVIVSDAVNSNCWVFVNPPDGNVVDLFAMTPDAHDGPDVGGWAGPASPAGIGSVDIDNYCGNGQPGYLISKMALSTNYTDVYNFLTQAPCSAPTASFTPASASGAAPLTVNFTDTSVANSGTITTWVWTFGDGGTSSSQNPSHTYTLPGTYTASLSVTNSCGDGSASPATATVNVYDPYAWWRLEYFGSTNSASGAPGVDVYGTGMSNTNKFMAGFSGTNSAAYLHILSFNWGTTTNYGNVTYLGANGDNTYTPGIASRTNILEYMAGTANKSYTNGGWQPTGQTNILSGGNGLGVVTNMTDTSILRGSNGYYRVRVLLP
jgi:PKD repeat protein